MSLPNKSGIYRILNTINGKVYIGSSKNINRRCINHRYMLNKGVHRNDHLQNAWNKYGEDAFIFEVLELVNNPETINSMEQKYLDQAQPEYNILKFAGPTTGYKYTKKDYKKREEYWTDERRKQYSIDRSGEKSFMWGRKHTEETKRIMSQKASGKKNHNYGKKASKKAREKMSNALSGENGPLAKLTWKDVRKIRYLYESGKHTQTELSHMWGVCLSSIGNIVHYKTWKET